jgi:hypothetical protein
MKSYDKFDQQLRIVQTLIRTFDFDQTKEKLKLIEGKASKNELDEQVNNLLKEIA